MEIIPDRSMNLERIILLFRPDLVAFKTILEDEVAE